MFGLSFTRANAPATPSASPSEQNQKSKRRSPLTRTLKKLKKVLTRSGSKEIVSAANDDDPHEKSLARQPQAASKSTPATWKPLPPTPFGPTEQPRKANPRQFPRTEGRVASPLPVLKVASPIQCTPPPLSIRPSPDRDYPKPKIIYKPAEIANAKYNEDLARNTAFSHKVLKRQEERRSRRDGTTGCQLHASSKRAVVPLKATVSASYSDSTHQKHLGRHSQAASRSTAYTGSPLPPVPFAPTQPTTEAGLHHLPKTPNIVASSHPMTKTAYKVSSNGALLANPSELKRYLDQYPKPKIVYTQAEAKAVVDAFIANAKYEEDLARNTHFSRKVRKPREERHPSPGWSVEVQTGCPRYSTACEGVSRSQEVPMYEARQDTTAQVTTSSSNLEPSPTEVCAITVDEMEVIMQNTTQLGSVWHKAKVNSRSCEFHEDLKPAKPSATAKQTAKRDNERRDRARGRAYLKLIGEL
ncbi:hypothetical protein FS837_010417 [Tulasnella sp. UAMH 9824]|nr:hypothetical protein FS837_010417 [Tulasnella sp. UAMH 9824]